MTDETADIVSRARAALDGITPGEWEPHEEDFRGLVFAIGNLADADVRFALAAPDLVRDLLAKVEKLESVLVGSNRSRRLLIAERDDARAEVARLRERICEHAKCPGGSLCCCNPEDATADLAAVRRVRKLAGDLEDGGCVSCGSITGGDALAESIRGALDGEA